MKTVDLNALEAKVDQALATKAKPTELGTAPNPTPDALFPGGQVPTARKGENIMGSRGYSMLNLIQAVADPHKSVREDAKIELMIHDKIAKNCGNRVGSQSFEGGYTAPWATEFFADDMRKELSEHLHAGVSQADPDEMFRMGVKLGMGGLRYGMKASAQSWLDTTLGGAFVGPPQFGEPIELWRNQDALTRAGASVIGLPPTGRIVLPRQTTASVAYHSGEGPTPGATATNVGTGQLTLTAKKLMALLVYNRELLQFAGASIEALFRMDLTRSIVLGADQALLEGTGGEVKPLGLINTPNIVAVTPTTAASGNTGAILAPQDLYEFPSAVEENNIPDEAGLAFICRPKLYYKLLERRVDAITAADAAGLFTFSPFRQLGDPVANKNINGQRVITTTQVSKSRVQGTNTALTYLAYGYWPDFLIAMAPMMEFVVATQGNPAGLGDLFSQDQFAIKSILFYDGAARHPGGFAWCDVLQFA